MDYEDWLGNNMNNIIELLKFLWEQRKPMWEFLRKQWRGIIIGGLVTFASLYWIYSDDIGKLHNYGEKVGEFHILIGNGNDKLIVANELKLRFNPYIFRQKGNGDSTFCYPSFQVYTQKNGLDGAYYDNIRYDEPIITNSENYYYSILLENIKLSDKDTTAIVEIYRRAFPQNR